MDIEFVKVERNHVIFEVNNVDVSFANALRRIMLADVPSMAIEYVSIEENDSVIHDEILAHRLGLIPIKADADKFEWCKGRQMLAKGNHIEFILDVTAGKKAVKADGSVHVLSSQLRLVSKHERSKSPAQESDDDEDEDEGGVGLVHEDIVIAKLKPGQKLKMRCFATKGTGADHIKWSSVCTASYRATPSVTIAAPITDEEAEEIRKICPKNVYDIEDGELIVANMKACSMCRECVRVPKARDRIKLGRIKDSFCFSVESTGGIPASEIVKRSVRVLKEKCMLVRDNLE